MTAITKNGISTTAPGYESFTCRGGRGKNIRYDYRTARETWLKLNSKNNAREA